MTVQKSNLQVKQANSFYNYTFGLDVTHVDLLKTANKLLKSGVTRAVCFSDLKAIYHDSHGELQIEWLRPEGRKWDNSWMIKFSDSLPKHIVDDLTFCLGLSFNEQRIECAEVKQVPSHLRAALPPIVLDSDDLTLSIYPWLKLYSDGIMSISFQLDADWENLAEEDFIHNTVNLFQRYFDRIWVQAELQRMDGEQLSPGAFMDEMTIGGQSVNDRKNSKFIREMRRTAKITLEESLNKEGRSFDLNGESWKLHQIAGSEEQTEWEATIDLCRSIYASAIESQVVVMNKKENKAVGIQLWQGRPSISLMRYVDQPQSKKLLLNKYGSSMSRILLRSSEMEVPPPLPQDLRPFEDYCFHGNRALLLWTWLRLPSEPEDVWNDPDAINHLLSNQARAEHFEYHNMRIARACATANEPPSDEHLANAHKTLANAYAVIHQSSQSGEITDALEFLMNAAGTTSLIESGKEQVRWHLDERRYKTEKNRSYIDRWLTAMFGFVGAAGLADLIVQPFLDSMYPLLVDWFTGLAAFGIASFIVGLFALLIVFVNKTRI
jgi:hypothetical protein